MSRWLKLGFISILLSVLGMSLFNCSINVGREYRIAVVAPEGRNITISMQGSADEVFAKAKAAHQSGDGAQKAIGFGFIEALAREGHEEAINYLLREQAGSSVTSSGGKQYTLRDLYSSDLELSDAALSHFEDKIRQGNNQHLKGVVSTHENRGTSVSKFYWRQLGAMRGVAEYETFFREQGAPDQSLPDIIAAAQFEFGRELLTTNSSVADKKHGFDLVLAAGQAGNPDAIEFLADSYQYGRGIPRDGKQAYLWALKHQSVTDNMRAINADRFGRFLSDDEREEAQQAARNWQPTREPTLVEYQT